MTQNSCDRCYRRLALLNNENGTSQLKRFLILYGRGNVTDYHVEQSETLIKCIVNLTKSKNLPRTMTMTLTRIVNDCM